MDSTLVMVIQPAAIWLGVGLIFGLGFLIGTAQGRWRLEDELTQITRDEEARVGS
jgi:hypothetical protein